MFAITSSVLRRCIAPVIVTSLLASCGDDAPSNPATGVLTAINVTFASSTIHVGQTTTARAVGVDQTGASLDLNSVTWSSANTAVAIVDAGGHVTAVAPGQAQITAVSGSKSGQANVTVIPAPVAAVAVTPTHRVVIVGFTLQMTALVLDSSGAPLTGRAISWSTSDASKATVSPDGLVTGVSLGEVTITATSEGKTGSAQLTSIPIATGTVAVAYTDRHHASGRHATVECSNALEHRTAHSRSRCDLGVIRCIKSNRERQRSRDCRCRRDGDRYCDERGEVWERDDHDRATRASVHRDDERVRCPARMVAGSGDATTRVPVRRRRAGRR